MDKILVVKIEPNKEPEIVLFEGGLYELGKATNIDKKGNPWTTYEVPNIIYVGDDIKIFSSPDGEKRGLPLVREIMSRRRDWIELYGVIYIVKTIKNTLDCISLSEEEANLYWAKFYLKSVTEENIFPNEQLAKLYENEHSEVKPKSLQGRITFTCDDW